MTTKEHLSLHDRQIAAIRDLFRDGIQLVIATRMDLRALSKDLRALAAAQRRTDEKLEKLLDVMLRGSNGHKKGKVDL
jgi:hypothetical protein